MFEVQSYNASAVKGKNLIRFKIVRKEKGRWIDVRIGGRIHPYPTAPDAYSAITKMLVKKYGTGQMNIGDQMKINNQNI